jgi:hypothetical protein
MAAAAIDEAAIFEEDPQNSASVLPTVRFFPNRDIRKALILDFWVDPWPTNYKTIAQRYNLDPGYAQGVWQRLRKVPAYRDALVSMPMLTFVANSFSWLVCAEQAPESPGRA